MVTSVKLFTKIAVIHIDVPFYEVRSETSAVWFPGTVFELTGGL